MGEMATWEELTAGINTLYEEKHYAEIETLIDANAHRFPDKEDVIVYTRICVAALLDHNERAIALMSDAAQHGMWFPQSRLRGDPDLAQLQGLPEFERLAAINLEQERTALADVKPFMPVSAPPGADHCPTLVAMHGNNYNAEGTAPHWNPATERGWLVAVPQSRQPGGPGKFVWDDLGEAEANVREYLDTLGRDPRADLGNMVLGGFSMGGGRACAMAINRTIPLRGFIGVAPWLKGFEAWEPQIDAAREAGLRGYLIVGDKDPGCYTDTLALHALLERHGLPCGLKVVPGLRHIYPDDFADALGDALMFITGGG